MKFYIIDIKYREKAWKNSLKNFLNKFFHRLWASFKDVIFSLIITTYYFTEKSFRTSKYVHK